MLPPPWPLQQGCVKCENNGNWDGCSAVFIWPTLGETMEVAQSALRERFMQNQVDAGIDYGLKEIFKDEINLSWFRIHRQIKSNKIKHFFPLKTEILIKYYVSSVLASCCLKLLSLLFAFAVLAAVSTLIYFVFLPAVPSSCSTVLLCLSVCFVWLFVWPFSSALPSFQQCSFLHTPAALLSLPYPQYGPLLFSYSWFHLLLLTFPRVSLALHLPSISQDLCLYFRAGLISDICCVLIVSLENSSIVGLNWIAPVASCKTSKGQSSCFGRVSIHTFGRVSIHNSTFKSRLYIYVYMHIL